MRRFLVGALIVGTAALFTGGRSFGADARLERSFQLTYNVRLEGLSPDAKQVQVWIPLANSDRHQTIRKRQIQAPVSYKITKDPEYGNDILFLQLKKPFPQSIDLSIRYEAKVQGEQLLATASVPRPSKRKDPAMALHLRPNAFVVINDEIRELARSVTAGAVTPEEKAQAIYTYVIERMTYEKETPGWGKGDVLRACEVGTGNCTDFHSLFIALARASGIPARFAMGLSVPEKQEGEIPGYHCWAEFHLDGTGWIPVDASEAWKDRQKMGYFFGTYDPNRLRVSLGRDIRLVPAPESEPLNIFFFPHVEVDGKTVGKENVKTRFNFKEIA